MEERISGALQENILTLACWDAAAAPMIRSIITPKLFDNSIYRDVLSHAFDFLDTFAQPIGDHLPDVLEHVLKGDDARKASAYERVLDNLRQAYEGINRDYVIASLQKFVRQQNIKRAILQAVEDIDAGRVDAAEVVLQQGLASQVVSFDVGTYLSDPVKALSFLDADGEFIHTGIAALDEREIGPRPGELFLIIAPPKKGKSWALMHLGKFGLLQRKKVLHITLEMGEDRVSMRYLQSMFSISKREAKVRFPELRLTPDGIYEGIDYVERERRTLKDPDIKSHLTNELSRVLAHRTPLIIKRFPTGMLTIPMLKAYLDSLERFHKFIPDLVILDYPDLMALDANNVRHSTGQIYKDLRGLAVERNFALAAASQGNRTSSDAKLITDSMVAEDFSKIATADNVITYNQTAQEREAMLARLYVSNGRNDEDKIEVLITQNYAVGQFALSSTAFLGTYRQSQYASPDHRSDDEEAPTERRPRRRL